ncbi:MAG: type IV toxin-antitoxin system AbiEi family antitoxin domain-containing protein [Quadrisphaera sp.]
MTHATTALRRVRSLAASQDDVVTRQQVLDSGVPEQLLRMLVAAGDWKRLQRGTYLVEPAREGGDLQRSWGRSGVLLVPGAVVSHHTAAVLLGVQGVPRTGVVHVTRAAKAAPRRLLVPHRAVLGPHDVVDLGGLLVTSPCRTLADLVPRLDPMTGLAVLDSALHTELASSSDLDAAHAIAERFAGHPITAGVWAMADGRAASPLESRVRWRCVRCGVVPVELQRVVLGRSGEVVARADFSFDWGQLHEALGVPLPPGPLRKLPLLGEADGRRYHPDLDDELEDTLVWDRRRQNAVTALGFSVVRFTWSDTLSRGAVAAGLRDQLLGEAA